MSSGATRDGIIGIDQQLKRRGRLGHFHHLFPRMGGRATLHRFADLLENPQAADVLQQACAAADTTLRW